MILGIYLGEGSKTGAAYSDDGTAVAPDGAWLPPNHLAHFRWTVAAIALAMSATVNSVPVCECLATGGSSACRRLSSAMRNIKASRLSFSSSNLTSLPS